VCVCVCVLPASALQRLLHFHYWTEYGVWTEHL